MVKIIIKPQIRRDICCLILNAALQVHFLTEYRKKAQELKDLADFGYAGLFGKGQTKVTTEIIER